MPIDLVAGILGGVAVLGLLVGLRWLVAYLRADGDSPLRTAFSRTGKWSMALVGGVGGASALGVLSLADVAGQLFAFVAGHPYCAVNLGTIGLGAGVLSGVLSLSTSQYIGVAVAFVGVVMLVVEVEDD